jgi:8-amino-7-oxononanoate synthase
MFSMQNPYPYKWVEKLNSAKRELWDFSKLVDFASNDYLGFSKQQKIKKIIVEHFDKLNWQGSTGSRLISGNKKWIEEIENKIAQYHHAESSVIYPSAYQANVGLLSCIANKDDVYLMDKKSHASIYDGVRLSFAKHYKFEHNNFQHLKELIEKFYHKFQNIFVLVEGLYSMDGDYPDVKELSNLIDNKKVFLVADESHSVGVLGEKNLGLFNQKEFAEKCVARVIGYGKAFGFSGGAVVGSEVLKKLLVNFSRSFIFSTALPLYHYQLIELLYDELLNHSENERNQLFENISYYLIKTKTHQRFSKNHSPIQYFSLSGLNYFDVQKQIIDKGIFAKVILPPTVEKGNERIRISLHSFNSQGEIDLLINTLKTQLSE